MRRSPSPATKRRSASTPSAHSRSARERLAAKPRFAKSFQVAWQQIFRPVNDAQILGAATFERRLNQAIVVVIHPVERLDDHAFSAARGQFEPPILGIGDRFFVAQIQLAKRRGDANWFMSRKLRERFHVPDVRLIYVNRAFARQQMKRRELQIFHAIDGPAIPLERRAITRHRVLSNFGFGLPCADIQPIFRGQIKRQFRGEERRLPRIGDGRVLARDQFLRFGRPRQKLGVETKPVGLELVPPT